MTQTNHPTANYDEEPVVIGYVPDQGDGQLFIFQTSERLANQLCDWTNTQPITFRLGWYRPISHADGWVCNWSPTETTEQQFARDLIQQVRAHWAEEDWTGEVTEPTFPEWLTDLAADC